MPKFGRLFAFLAHFIHRVCNLSPRHPKMPYATNFVDFKILMPYMEEKSLENCLKVLNDAEKPDYLFGKPVPKSLNGITFGAYSDLCEALGEKNHIKMLSLIIKAVYPLATDKDIDELAAYDVWGFAIFAAKETDRINKLFGDIRLEYTEQEKKAGIDKLQFGVFGILDWYAKRMGIIDQNQVNNEKWVRIYQCMKNDMEEAAFNRRLQKVYENEAKVKHR